MKQCPHCKKRFEDEMFFCLDDGIPLTAVADQVDPSAPTEAYGTLGSAAPTELLPGAEVLTQEIQAATRSPRMAVPGGGQPVADLPHRRSSAISYLIIGALAATCLALAVALLFVYRAQILGPQNAANNVTSNVNVVSPPGSTPVTPANTVVAVSNQPVKQTAKPLSPAGRWRGEWSTESGTLLDFNLSLTETSDGKVEGQIRWTMRKTARPDKMDKVGLSATEFVRGTFEPDGSVNMKGYRKEDPNNVLVLLDDYRLKISPDARSLTGAARNGGKWNGRVRLSRSAAGD